MTCESHLAAEALPPLDRAPLEPRDWFELDLDPSTPLDLEIGSGKGTYLLQHAPTEPGVLFLGVEYARAYGVMAAERLHKHGIDNARVIALDAQPLITHYLAAGSVRRIHLYFPDPWPKAKHHKRRTMQETFLRAMHRVLVPRPIGADPDDPAGHVRIATDHAEYFDWMQDHAARVDDIFERLPFEPDPAAGEGELVGTNFERKYRREGRAFFGMVLCKRPG